MTTARAGAGIRLTGRGIEPLAAHAHEGGFASFVLEKGVVTPVVENPQPKKKHRDEQAVNDSGGGEIHGMKTKWHAAPKAHDGQCGISKNSVKMEPLLPLHFRAAPKFMEPKAQAVLRRMT